MSLSISFHFTITELTRNARKKGASPEVDNCSKRFYETPGLAMTFLR